MLIAKTDTFELSMFGTQFPNTKPSMDKVDTLLNLQGWARVVSVKTYNTNTEKLVECDPYFESPLVYTVRIEPLTAEEQLAVSRSAMVVTMRQARRAMSAAGLLSAVEEALDAIVDQQEREAALIEWEYATEVKRDYPWVQLIAGQLGMTEEQLDALFVSAATY